MKEKRDIDHLNDIVENFPEMLALPVFSTSETKRGEIAVMKIPKKKSKLHQTSEYIFRRANYKRIL